MTTIPTFNQLYTSILSDLETQYGITISLFGKVFLRALAMVQAAKIKLIYLQLGFLQKNIFVDTADPESLGGTLERFGRVKLNRNPFPAVSGQYTVEVIGEIGAVIPASTTFKSDDDALNPSMIYILDDAFTLTTNPDTIIIRSLTSGLTGKLAIGNTLTSTQPIALVQSSVAVTVETVPPLAGETIEEYRSAIIAAFQLEAQGGAATDYRLWSFDVQGVKNTYPYAKSGNADEINVFVESTIADSIDDKGTPSATMLTNVRQAIEFDPDTTQPVNERGRRPLGVYAVHCIAITPLDVDIEIVGYLNATVQKQAAILSALTTEINKIRPFIAGCDILSERNDVIDQNILAYIIISAVQGSIFTGINISINGTPVTTYQFDNGDIPYLNSVTYV